MSTAAVGTFLVDAKWSSGVLYYYEKAVGRTATGDILSIGTTAVTIGGTAQDVDFGIYGASSKSIVFDSGNGTLTLTGVTAAFKGNVTYGVDGTGVDVTFYGDTASYKVWWDQDGDTNGTWYFGADDYGVDVKLFGQTASCYGLWDASEDKLSIVQTNGATSGTETCFSNAMTMTGVGAKAEAAICALTINAAAGDWTNALCARTTYGASGRTTGLSGVICSELNLSAGCTSGSYALFEGEMIMAAGALTGTNTSMFYMNVSGAAAATFDNLGYLFTINGVTSGSGDFWYANKSVPFDAYLKIKIGSTDYYLGVLAQQAAAS